MKIIHIFAPQNHSNRSVCDVGKMTSHSFVTRHCEAVQRHDHNYYPYGALFAESTNGDVQRFKYNGKELDRKFSLNWYDHGARHNDAAIGRWHSMDPMVEKYYGISPYAYCGGDPANLGDYDGMDIYEFDTLGSLTITENKIFDIVCVKGVNEVLIYRYGSITHFEDDGYYIDSETNTQTTAHFNCMKI